MKRIFAGFCVFFFGAQLALAAGEMPLVYDKEHTGGDVKKPPMPAFADLKPISYLPDPFMKADGNRISTKDDWRVRRAEIKSILEEYDVGEKPGRPAKFEPKFNGNTITITLGEGDQTLTMTARITRPAGAPADKAIPALINVGGGGGPVVNEMLTSRGIATITFNSGEIAPQMGQYSQGNFVKLYPKSTAGIFMRWAWGVSRLIDALEALPEAKIDTKHLAVMGCSYAGKMALYAGAFDERIALTIPHESGGGGTISWRYSDMLEKRDKVEVENLLHAQGGSNEFGWYARALRQFNKEPDKLPFDHHELIAMIAPRAVLMIESTMVPRMGAEAARIDAMAAKEVWKALGVQDRIGVTEANIAHCQWSASYTPDVEACLDKFMIDKKDGKPTDFLRSKFEAKLGDKAEREKWIPWTTPELK